MKQEQQEQQQGQQPEQEQEQEQESEQQQQTCNQQLREENQQLKRQVKELQEKNKNLIKLFTKVQSTVYSSYSQALENSHEEDERHGQSLYIEDQVVTFTQEEWDSMKGSTFMKFVLTKILEKHPTLRDQTPPENISKKTKDDVCNVIKKHFFDKHKSVIKNTWRGLVFKRKE